MASPIYTVEITVYDPGVPGTRTLYYATHDGLTTTPADTPANTAFRPRVTNPGTLSRFLYASNALGGLSDIGHGQIILNNADGALDALRGYGWGRTVTVRRGNKGDAYPGGFTTLFSGIVQFPRFSLYDITLEVNDTLGAIASLPLQPTKFAGTNSGSTGVEGLPADLQGKPKPILYGVAINCPLPVANASALIFQISDRAINSIQAVRDKAVAISVGTSRANLAALQANTPSAGTYDYSLGGVSEGAYIRLGTTPKGTVTADVTEGTNAAARTAAQIASRMLQERGGLSGAAISSSAVTALDGLNSSVVGWWWNEETTIGAAIDQILQSVGGWWGMTRAGLITMGRLDAPSGSPAATITSAYIIRGAGGDAVQRFPARANDSLGVPVYKVVCNYAPNFQPQSENSLDSSVAVDVKSQYAQNFRNVTDQDVAVQTAHPNATQMEITTALSTSGAAATEATRVLTLYKSIRDKIRIRVRPEQSFGLDLGSLFLLQVPRFDWNGAGKLMVVTGLIEDYADNSVTIEGFG